MWKIGCVIIIVLVVLFLIADFFRGCGSAPAAKSPQPAAPAGKLPAGKTANGRQPVIVNVPEKLEPGAIGKVYPRGMDPETGSPVKIVERDGVSGFPVEGFQSELILGYMNVEKDGKYNFTVHVPEKVVTKLSVDGIPLLQTQDAYGCREEKDMSTPKGIDLNKGFHKIDFKLTVCVYDVGDNPYSATVAAENMQKAYVLSAPVGEQLQAVKVFREAK